jgi:hypothetical protein
MEGYPAGVLGRLYILSPFIATVYLLDNPNTNAVGN